jgi:cell division septation protein DedD
LTCPRLHRVLLPLIAIILLVGCESGQKTGTGLKLATQDYERQQYEQSRERATAVMRSGRVVEREQAAYIAGLSAFELGMIDEAERRFMTAARSSDAEVAAKAKAMLGQIRLNQGRHTDAANLFDEASSGLAAVDARQARTLAGQARRAAAGDRAMSGEFRIETTHTVATPDSGFALQVGAFHEQVRANRAADEARQLADRNGIGPVTIVPSTDQRGRTLYLVRIGHFETRRAAAEARQRLGRLDYIVAAWSRSSTGG